MEHYKLINVNKLAKHFAQQIFDNTYSYIPFNFLYEEKIEEEQKNYYLRPKYQEVFDKLVDGLENEIMDFAQIGIAHG